MNIYLYIDESGKIHKNNKTRYFAVGGYFVTEKDKNKVISNFKRANLNVKLSRSINLKTEIKSFDYLDNEKVDIFNSVQNIDSFVGCAKIFDKDKMYKKIDNENLFYNYAVSLLISDCIIPFISKSYDCQDVNFIIKADNRSVSVGDLNDLEKYLKTKYCLNNYDFSVKYYDSASDFGIQLADLIVNTFYNKFKNKKIVENVLPHLNSKNFIISKFPYSI